MRADGGVGLQLFVAFFIAAIRTAMQQRQEQRLYQLLSSVRQRTHGRERRMCLSRSQGFRVCSDQGLHGCIARPTLAPAFIVRFLFYADRLVQPSHADIHHWCIGARAHFNP